MFSKEEKQQEREKAMQYLQKEREKVMQYYGIANDATDEEIRDCVYRNLVIPSYEDFKHALFGHIRDVGIKDDKEDIIDVLDPDSYVWEDTRYFFGVEGIFSNLNGSDNWPMVENLYTDVEEWFSSVVSEANKLYAFDDDEMNDIYSIGDNMPSELDDRNPLIIFDKYIDRMEKEDLQELKDLIMSLAQEDEE